MSPMMADREIEKYRANTFKDNKPYNWQTKTCPRCKRTRSPFNFVDSEICRACRGLK